MTLCVHAARPRCRQVLECGRASAAFLPAPAVKSSNLDTILARFRVEANDPKNFVLRPGLPLHAPFISPSKPGKYMV